MSMDFIDYLGTRYYVQTTGKYYQSRRPVMGTRLLHRRVWIEHNGEIPDGFDIHHVDGNWKNNSIDNLETIDRHKHMSLHAVELYKDEEYCRKVELGRLKAIKKAPEWHRSPEGIAWHSDHGIKSWDNRKKIKQTCKYCGTEFESYRRDAICCISCRNARFSERCRIVKKICLQCGKEFEIKSIYANHTKCCSRSCGAKYRWANTKKV